MSFHTSWKVFVFPFKCALVYYPVASFVYSNYLHGQIDKEYWIDPPTPVVPEHIKNKKPTYTVWADGTKLEYEDRAEVDALLAKHGLDEELKINEAARMPGGAQVQEQLGAGTSLIRDINNTRWVPADTAETTATVLRSRQHSLTGTLPAQEWDQVKAGLKLGDVVLMQGNSTMSWMINGAQFLNGWWCPGGLRYSHIGLVVGPLPDQTNDGGGDEELPTPQEEALKALQAAEEAAKAGSGGWWNRFVLGAFVAPTVRESRAAAAIAKHDEELRRFRAEVALNEGSAEGVSVKEANLTSPLGNKLRSLIYEYSRCGVSATAAANDAKREPHGQEPEPLIFNAIDNTDTKFASPVDGELRQRQCTIDYAADRIFARIGNYWGYRRAAVRRLEGVKWTKDRLRLAEEFLAQNLGRPTDVSPFLPMAYADERLYWRRVPESICCSEVIVDFYKAIGVMARDNDDRTVHQFKDGEVKPFRAYMGSVMIPKDLEFDTKMGQLARQHALRAGDTSIEYKPVSSIQVAPYHFTADYETYARRQKTQTGVNHWIPGQYLYEGELTGFEKLQFVERGVRLGPEELIAMDRIPKWHKNYCTPEEYHPTVYNYLKPWKWW